MVSSTSELWYHQPAAEKVRLRRKQTPRDMGSSSTEFDPKATFDNWQICRGLLEYPKGRKWQYVLYIYAAFTVGPN